ncbi:MAG: SLC13 family permease [Chloroflexota bacterium]
MTLDQILVLAILGGAVVLFVTEKLRADLVALLVLLSLLLTNLLTVEEAFLGFANPAVVTVWAVFIISGGLQRSGVADIIAQYLLRWAGNSEFKLLVYIMLGAGVMSAFMNNIGAVAILMPAVISIGRKLDIPVSRLLMPLAFAALLGGNMTLIGTPPNILANSIMEAAGVEPFEFFDFAPTGIVVLLCGVVYMLFVGRWLIPARTAESDLVDQYPVKDYLAELKINSTSSLIDKRLDETDLGSEFNLNVVQVQALDKAFESVRGHRLQSTDTLLLEGKPEDILRASKAYSLESVIAADASASLSDIDTDDFHLAEVTLAPNSELDAQTVEQIDLRNRYGLSLLALRHHGFTQVEQLGNTPVRFGDSLLVYGSAENLQKLLNNPNLLVLESPKIELRRLNKAPLSTIILLGVLISAALGWFHVSVLMLAGALLMVIGGVLKMDEAYRAIDWKAIFLIGGMLPLGLAMEKTGTVQLIADQLIGVTGGWGAVASLCAIFLLTALLTEVISNAAAAVLMIPIAIDIGFGLGLDPRPFVMATVIAASTSFLMPIGHQVNIIIFGAGGYQFFDYARVGIWLNLILLLVVAIFVPIFWPF